MIYLDNNATTMMPADVKRAQIYWCNRGNPSAGYGTAAAARNMMMDFRRLIGKIAGVNICCPEPRDSPGAEIATGPVYKVIYTSGGSEANATIINHFCTRGGRNHVIASAIEHKSVLSHLTSARDRGQILLSIVPPRADGSVHPDDIAAQIRPDTTLICVMHANNETGAINDVAAISKLARGIDAHFHCDTVQSFGKIPVPGADLDSFSISFHKLHGPPGTGALVIRSTFLPLIYGSQNEHLRGGTENLPGIGAAALAVSMTAQCRNIKNRRQQILKQYIIGTLSRVIRTLSYEEYAKNPPTADCIVALSNASDRYLPGTLLISLVSRRVSVCNVKMKNTLAAKNVIVSVGSACNTASDSASHVLHAMGCDDYVRRGTLRVSMCDATSYEDIKKFVNLYAEVCDSVLRGRL